MAHNARTQLDWNVRYGARSTYTERVAGDTLEGVADLLARHMPASAGYEVRRVRLSGPLRGASFRIKRGAFMASVSVQMFQSPGRCEDEADGFELRVVARAQQKTTALACRPRRAGVRLTSGAAASLGVGALAMAISGSLTAWATAVLLIPAVFATRLCMTLWIAETLKGRSKAQAELPAATRSAAQVRDERRWQGVLTGLQQLHENAAARLMLRPFRGMGTSAQPLALGPATGTPLRSVG